MIFGTNWGIIISTRAIQERFRNMYCGLKTFWAELRNGGASNRFDLNRLNFVAKQLKYKLQILEIEYEIETRVNCRYFKKETIFHARCMWGKMWRRWVHFHGTVMVFNNTSRKLTNVLWDMTISRYSLVNLKTKEVKKQNDMWKEQLKITKECESKQRREPSQCKRRNVYLMDLNMSLVKSHVCA